MYLSKNILFIVAETGKVVFSLLMIRAFRPDRLVSTVRMFIEKILGETFAHTAEKELNLSEVVENEVL